MNSLLKYALISSACLVTGLLTPLHSCGEDAVSNTDLLTRWLNHDQRDEPRREIYVPTKALDILLRQGPQRVFLTRQEYDELRKKAKEAKPTPLPPVDYSLLSANYSAEVQAHSVHVTGTLQIETFARGLTAIPLSIGRAKVLWAKSGKLPAPLGWKNSSTIELFLTGPQVHEIQWALSLPLEKTAAQQAFSYTLPRAATTQLRLQAAGNIDVQQGAAVISRQFDESKQITSFEIMPPAATSQVVLSLNNRRQQLDRVVTAESILFSERTRGNENLQIRTTLNVLHGAIQSARFRVPPGYEVQDVESTQAAGWKVEQQPEGNILQVALRSPVSDRVTLTLFADRTAPETEDWKLRTFEPLDVATSSSVVGVLTTNKMSLHGLQTSGLIRLGNSTIVGIALQPAVQQESLYVVGAWFAPSKSFDLSASVEPIQRELHVDSQWQLDVHRAEIQLNGDLKLFAVGLPLFEFDIVIPSDWTYLPQSGEKEAPYRIDAHSSEGESTRLRVQIPQGWKAGGEPFTLPLALRHVAEPTNPAGDTAPEIEFPNIAIPQATREVGTISLDAEELLHLEPVASDDLLAIAPPEGKGRFAYRFVETNFELRIAYRGRTPRLSARTISLFELSPESLSAHYELEYVVREAPVRQLAIRIPALAAQEFKLHGLDGTKVLQYAQETLEDGSAVWNVELAEAAQGRIRLGIELDSPWSELASPADSTGTDESAAPDDSASSLRLPIAAADNVALQSGLVGIEVDSALAIEPPTTAMRPVDVGELADADYKLGRHVAGAFAYEGDAPTLDLIVRKRDLAAMPTALVERAALVTLAGTEGESCTVARFSLRTVEPFLVIALPQKAELWTVLVDGRPAKPQQDGERMIVGLPRDENRRDALATPLRNVQIVYQLPDSRGRLWKNAQVPAPELRIRAGRDGQSAPIPLGDLHWELQLPSGYRLIDSSNHVTTTELPSPRHPFPRALESLFGVEHQVTALGSSHASAPSGADKAEAEVTYYAAGTKDEKSREVAEHQILADMQADEPTARPNGEVVDALAERAPQSATTVAQAKESEELDQDVAPLPPRSARSTTTRQWVLSGLAGLDIDVSPSVSTIAFDSLGGSPRLDVQFVNENWTKKLAWGAVWTILAVGIALTRASLTRQMSFVAGVLVAASLIPILTSWDMVLGQVFHHSIVTALLLIPYFLFVQLAWSVGARLISATYGGSRQRARQATGSAILLLLILAPGTSVAQQEKTPEVITLIPPRPKVQVPDDALIIPYDTNHPKPSQDEEQVLIPYEEYVALTRLGEETESQGSGPLPARFAVAAGTYQIDLGQETEDNLEITARIDIEVFDNGAVEVPFWIADAVLLEARVDDRPAKVRLSELRLESSVEKESSKQRSVADIHRNQMHLVLEGKGWHELNLRLRLAVRREGGWKVVRGYVPQATAGLVQLTMPQQDVEFREERQADKANQVFSAGQVTESSLGDAGLIAFRYRPREIQSFREQALTANSEMLVDIHEGAIRSTWKLLIEFSGAARDEFSLILPRGVLLENISGPNVRGWQRAEGAPENVTVTLLAPAKNQTQLMVSLLRPHSLQSDNPEEDKPEEWDVPPVKVRDASLQSGTITVRRSPTLDLHVAGIQGATRTDLPPSESLAALDTHSVVSPLGMRPFAAFQFYSVGYRLRLAVTPRRAIRDAAIQALLKVESRVRTLEFRATISPQGLPLFESRIAIPAELRVDLVTLSEPGRWYLNQEDGGATIAISLDEGTSRPLEVVVQGQLGAATSLSELALPAPFVQDAKNAGTLVIQSDPVLKTSLSSTEGFRTIALKETYQWLQAQQRESAQLAVQWDTPSASGTLDLTERSPQVEVRTLTNLLFTEESVEETTLLDLQVREAGVREITFLLPARLAEARISAPLLRQKTVTPLQSADGQDQVRVRLELQEAQMGELRVLIQHDMPLGDENYQATVPLLETGTTKSQYITFENAGRDEVTVESATSMEPVNRQERAYQYLSTMLGSNPGSAYLSSASDCNLTLATKKRETQQTVDARIGLAESYLIIDRGGAFRGRVTYHTASGSEPYLLVRLPNKATLWTAHVDGRPVKPGLDSAGNDHVRIPLVRTAVGDLDYPVVLTFGGALAQPSLFSRTQFPFIQTVNIAVERNQVELRLPESRNWFGFDSNMRRAAAQADILEGVLDYQRSQVERLASSITLDSTSSFSKSREQYSRVRAENNLKKLQLQQQQLEEQVQFGLGDQSGKDVKKRIVMNRQILEQAQSKAEQAARFEAAESLTNRGKLSAQFEAQRNFYAANVTQELGANFDAPSQSPDNDLSRFGEERGGNENYDFQTEWLEQNELAKKPAEAKQDAEKPNAGDGAGFGGGGLGGGAMSGGAPTQLAWQYGRNQQRQSGEAQAVQQQRDLGLRADPQQQSGQVPATNTWARGVERYREQLQDEALVTNGSGPALNAPDFTADLAQPGRPQVQEEADGTLTPGVLPPSGQASLSMAIPRRGQVVRFTSTRGNIEVSARSITQRTLARWGGFVGIALAGVIMWAGWRFINRTHLAKYRRVSSLLIAGVTLCAAIGFGSVYVALTGFAAALLMWLGVESRASRRHELQLGLPRAR